MERFNTPVVSILALFPVTLLLMELPFDTLVEFTSVMNCFTLIAEFAAFLRFRYTLPDENRPFKIPGGMIGAWATCITMWILIFVTLVFTEWWILLTAVIADFIILLGYGAKVMWLQHFHVPCLEKYSCYGKCCSDVTAEEDSDQETSYQSKDDINVEYGTLTKHD